MIRGEILEYHKRFNIFDQKINNITWKYQDFQERNKKKKKEIYN